LASGDHGDCGAGAAGSAPAWVMRRLY
jgi:hypothetical protein